MNTALTVNSVATNTALSVYILTINKELSITSVATNTPLSLDIVAMRKANRHVFVFMSFISWSTRYDL